MDSLSQPTLDAVDHPFSRRTFLGGAGALLVAGMAGAGAQAAASRPARTAEPGALPHRPNIVVVITDQERAPMFWPEGWAETNLPNRKRLADTGSRSTAAAAMPQCARPVRSTFFTGLYPAQHGVTATLTEGGTVSPTEPTLPLGIQNMAKLLDSAGYNVHYRGKWHMSKGEEGGDPSSADVAAYGFRGWVPRKAARTPTRITSAVAAPTSTAVRVGSRRVPAGTRPQRRSPVRPSSSRSSIRTTCSPTPRRGTPSTAPATTTVRTRPESSSRASTCRRRTKRPWSGTSSPPRRSSPRRFSPPGWVRCPGRTPPATT